QEHQRRLEIEARIQNYQNNTNKRPHSGSHNEPAQREPSQLMDTTQDGAADNQSDFSTTDSPTQESAHELPIRPARIQISQPVPKGNPPAPPDPSEKFKGKDIRE